MRRIPAKLSLLVLAAAAIGLTGCVAGTGTQSAQQAMGKNPVKHYTIKVTVTPDSDCPKMITKDDPQKVGCGDTIEWQTNEPVEIDVPRDWVNLPQSHVFARPGAPLTCTVTKPSSPGGATTRYFIGWPDLDADRSPSVIIVKDIST